MIGISTSVPEKEERVKLAKCWQSRRTRSQGPPTGLAIQTPARFPWTPLHTMRVAPPEVISHDPPWFCRAVMSACRPVVVSGMVNSPQLQQPDCHGVS
jgi:hypothetical protein